MFGLEAEWQLGKEKIFLKLMSHNEAVNETKPKNYCSRLLCSFSYSKLLEFQSILESEFWLTIALWELWEMVNWLASVGREGILNNGNQMYLRLAPTHFNHGILIGVYTIRPRVNTNWALTCRAKVWKLVHKKRDRTMGTKCTVTSRAAIRHLSEILPFSALQIHKRLRVFYQ